MKNDFVNKLSTAKFFGVVLMPESGCRFGRMYISCGISITLEHWYDIYLLICFEVKLMKSMTRIYLVHLLIYYHFYCRYRKLKPNTVSDENSALKIHKSHYSSISWPQNNSDRKQTIDKYSDFLFVSFYWR